MQQRQLLALVGPARATAFGRDHDFAGVRSIADFQARVGAVYPETAGRRGGHLFIVEFAAPQTSTAQVAAFATRLDRNLSATGEAYAANRAPGQCRAAAQLCRLDEITRPARPPA